jgi:hypothetical protein
MGIAGELAKDCIFQEGSSMYVLFIPALLAVVVIGFIQLRDQFAVGRSEAD